MKTLLIELTRVSNAEVIMLHDLHNKHSQYIYTAEYNYIEWVIQQLDAFRSNGYKIFNSTDIDFR
jgi:hypothetical protein